MVQIEGDEPANDGRGRSGPGGWICIDFYSNGEGLILARRNTQFELSAAPPISWR